MLYPAVIHQIKLYYLSTTDVNLPLLLEEYLYGWTSSDATHPSRETASSAALSAKTKMKIQALSCKFPLSLAC